jgi:hypothetical protein
MQPADVEKYGLNHVGWYPTLWFPEVQRDAINFPTGPTDDEVHAALFRLIQTGSIEVRKTAGMACVVVNDPTPEVLEDIRTNSESEYELELSEGARRQLLAALERSKVPVRDHFELFAHGVSFDVDTYLKSAPLEFDLVWHRGEGCYRSNGVARLLGNGAIVSLADQQRIAVEFLSANRDSLMALARFPGVETFILGLQFNIELTEGLVGSCLSPSAVLMSQAQEIGISPTFYIDLNRPGEPPHYRFSDELFLKG